MRKLKTKKVEKYLNSRKLEDYKIYIKKRKVKEAIQEAQEKHGTQIMYGTLKRVLSIEDMADQQDEEDDARDKNKINCTEKEEIRDKALKKLSAKNLEKITSLRRS